MYVRGSVAPHRGIGDPGGFVLLRPDAYRAALLAQATPESIANALRTALARNTTP